MREVERRAELYGLPAIRWPDPYPANSLTVMRAATFAESLGCCRAFAQAAEYGDERHWSLRLGAPVSRAGADRLNPVITGEHMEEL